MAFNYGLYLLGIGPTWVLIFIHTTKQMKTPKQVETVEFAKAHVDSELNRIDELASKLVKVMKGHEPLLGDAGPGNTHGDNMEIRSYAKFIAEQIRVILYNPLMSTEDIVKWRIHLYETHFKDPEIRAWRDVLGGIV